jgi:hypothetical protein
MPTGSRFLKSRKYAEFRKAVLEWAVGAVHGKDKKLLTLVRSAVIQDDGKVHITDKLPPREFMTLSFLKMALFGVDPDVPFGILFNNYAQQLGALMILNGQVLET